MHLNNESLEETLKEKLESANLQCILYLLLYRYQLGNVAFSLTPNSYKIICLAGHLQIEGLKSNQIVYSEEITLNDLRNIEPEKYAKSFAQKCFQKTYKRMEEKEMNVYSNRIFGNNQEKNNTENSATSEASLEIRIMFCRMVLFSLKEHGFSNVNFTITPYGFNFKIFDEMTIFQETGAHDKHNTSPILLEENFKITEIPDDAYFQDDVLERFTKLIVSRAWVNTKI